MLADDLIEVVASAREMVSVYPASRTEAGRKSTVCVTPDISVGTIVLILDLAFTVEMLAAVISVTNPLETTKPVSLILRTIFFLYKWD